MKYNFWGRTHRKGLIKNYTWTPIIFVVNVQMNPKHCNICVFDKLKVRKRLPICKNAVPVFITKTKLLSNCRVQGNICWSVLFVTTSNTVHRLILPIVNKGILIKRAVEHAQAISKQYIPKVHTVSNRIVALVYLNLSKPLCSGIWCHPAEITEDSPLPFILSMCCPQGDIALRFIYFAKGNCAFQPSGPVEERDKGVLKNWQHSGTQPVSTFTLGAQDPECSDIIGLGDFYCPADPNTINHIFRHMLGLWPMDLCANSKKTKTYKELVFLDSNASHVMKQFLNYLVVIWWSCSQYFHLLHMWPWINSLWKKKKKIMCFSLFLLKPASSLLG